MNNSCVPTVASVSLRRRAYGQFMEIHVQKIFVRLAYLCSEKLSLYGVELDLIYVRR